MAQLASEGDAVPLPVVMRERRKLISLRLRRRFDIRRPAVKFAVTDDGPGAGSPASPVAVRWDVWRALSRGGRQGPG
ncbi:hypothetical protein ATO4_24102 [Aurantimonas sp. 22II-16-19i]|nr:hypothetical protein ATO4_24102 [Aurantimonas sp. 22II-16-19i]